jgi:hypothetical protein
MIVAGKAGLMNRPTVWADRQGVSLFLGRCLGHPSSKSEKPCPSTSQNFSVERAAATTEQERHSIIREAQELARQEHDDAEPPPSRPNPIAELRRERVYHLRKVDLLELDPHLIPWGNIASPVHGFFQYMRALYRSGKVNRKPPLEPGLIPTGPVFGSGRLELEPARQAAKRVLEGCATASASAEVASVSTSPGTPTLTPSEEETWTGSERVVVEPAPSPERPRWDRARRQLLLGEETLYTWTREAPKQFAVLGVLQEAGWPEDGAKLPRSLNHRQAKDAVEGINTNLAPSRLRLSRRQDDDHSWWITWEVTSV